jgi:aminopeptidase N
MKQLFFSVLLILSVTSVYAQTNVDMAVAQDDTSVVKKLTEITLDTMEVIAPAGPTPYQYTAPKTWDITHTRIALTFDMKERTAEAREWIKLHPYFYGMDSVVLDAKGIRVDSLRALGRFSNLKFTYAAKRELLVIKFERTIKPSDTLELYLRYVSRPYGGPTGGSNAITDDRGLYFVNTDQRIPNKPVQIWTQGETESNSRWLVTIDKPNSRFTTQIELTVPDTFKTLSNGTLVSSAYRDHMRTDIWRMDMPIQAYAVMFAVGKFSIVKDRWRNKEVSYYVEPDYAPYAKLMFNNTPEMMEYFSKRTGVTFPWNKYSQVVVRDYVSGAMENTTASLFGEFVNQTGKEIADRNSEDIVSHELFHQWFGDYVTAESWSNLTVNESFANYGEQLWRAYKYGKASADELAWNDLQIYIGATQLNDPQLVRYHYDNREEVFDAISYNKGGAILHYLNVLMGDAAFDRAMNLYLTKNALSDAEAQDWRKAVEEATGQDWNWFFNEWYYRAGHPVLRMNYDYNDSLQKLIVTVKQEQEDSTFAYKLPLKAAVIYGSQMHVVDWNITRRTETYTYDYKDGVKPVIDPDYQHILPGEVRDSRKPEQWLAQYRTTDDYVNKRLAIAGAAKQISDSSSQVLIDDALRDKMPSIRKQALVSIRLQQSDKYRRKWTPKVIAMATTDTDRHVRAEAYDVLGTWKLQAAKSEMVRAATTDSSYVVAGNALEALSKLDLDTAYVLARAIQKAEPRSVLETAVWTVIGKKAMDDDVALFEQKVPYVFGTKKFAFSYSLSSYMKKVKSDASFKRAADVYLYLVTYESMKAYRMALGSSFLQVANTLKGEVTSEDKDLAAMAQRRLEVLKADYQKMIAVEKDADAVKEYKKSMAKIFE